LMQRIAYDRTLLSYQSLLVVLSREGKLWMSKLLIIYILRAWFLFRFLLLG